MGKNYLSKLGKGMLALFGVVGINAATAQVSTFDYTGTIQTYTVPDGVYQIEIEAIGAGGGAGDAPISGIAGKGARMTGTFDVTPGQVLNILVGEQGQSGTYVGGGGGGTFVWDDATSDLWIAAGGGGGGGASDGEPDYQDGLDASIDEDGVNGNGIPDGAGMGGTGGTVPTATNWAGGGAGFDTDGNDGSDHGCTQDCTGGISLGAGGLGGGTPGASAANGGYGGGGGGNARCGAVGGGGGGGYSGGGAGGEVVLGEYNGGGGGGSFNAGADQDNLAGANTANGGVLIVELCDPIVISYTTIDETAAGNGAIDITVTGGGGAYSYDWDNDGTGDFDDSEDLVGVTAGTYIVVVQDESICEDVTETIVVNSQIGIEENGLTLGVFPNPTTDMFTIALEGEFAYTVSNVNGQILVSGTGIDVESVNLSQWATGNYLVSVTSGEYSKTVTVVKK